MQRRLYFALPGVAQARRLVSELSAAGISPEHMVSRAPRNAEPAGLPRAADPQGAERLCEVEESLWFLNLLLFFTALAALVAALYTGHSGWATAAAALMLGSLAAGAASAARLPFARLSLPLHEGEVLVIVDVPRNRAREVERLVTKSHPGGMAGSVWTLRGLGI